MERKELVRNLVSYAASYASEDVRFFYKLQHSLEVAKICGTIAKSLHLREHDVELAWVIGLVHDIGRFAQLEQTSSLKDTNIFNHGFYGYQLLSDRLIYDFWDVPADYSLILTAVRYHNVLALPDTLISRENLFCNIVRDADIVDIFHCLYVSDFDILFGFTREELQQSDVSSEVMDHVLRKELVDVKHIKTPMDKYMSSCSMYFGLVFPVSVDIALRQGYFQKLLDFPFLANTNIRMMEVLKKNVDEFTKAKRIL